MGATRNIQGNASIFRNHTNVKERGRPLVTVIMPMGELDNGVKMTHRVRITRGYSSKYAEMLVAQALASNDSEVRFRTNTLPNTVNVFFLDRKDDNRADELREVILQAALQSSWKKYCLHWLKSWHLPTLRKH